MSLWRNSRNRAALFLSCCFYWPGFCGLKTGPHAPVQKLRKPGPMPLSENPASKGGNGGATYRKRPNGRKAGPISRATIRLLSVNHYSDYTLRARARPGRHCMRDRNTRAAPRLAWNSGARKTRARAYARKGVTQCNGRGFWTKRRPHAPGPKLGAVHP